MAGAQNYFCVALLISFATSLPAQNVIVDGQDAVTAPLVKLSQAQVEEIIDYVPIYSPGSGTEADRIVSKLDQHVTEFLEGAPWMPFHHTLGISGHEVYFNHPAEMFSALAIAKKFLPSATGERVKEFLAAQLRDWPPYAADGFDNKTGRARESYDVPAELRIAGRGKAASAFGVYAFWAYCHYVESDALSVAHWPAIKSRMQPLLTGNYVFAVARKDPRKDEAEKLNGDIAGLIGMVRLARLIGDGAAEPQAIERLRSLLEMRVNLERVNPNILEATESSTKHLHISKLARFCQLTPEVGEAVRRFTDGCGAARLKNFREVRNGWHLAFGDRLIGGENYTNPLHFSKALFDGAVMVESLPAEQIFSFVDVPWCKGDFYFIEKCAYALWAAAGRHFSSGTKGAPATGTPATEAEVISLFNGRDLTGLYPFLVDTKYDDPRRVFTVTNGALRISGEGLGYVATQASYSNYLLRVEFKWGNRNWAWGDRIGKARDSGIFLHSVGPDGSSHDGNGAFKAAIECNLFEGATGDFLLIRGNAADGSLLSPRVTVESAAERDADHWPFWQQGGKRVTLERWGRVNWFGKDRQWQDRIGFRGPRDVEKPVGEWNVVECRCETNRIQIRLNGVLVNEAFDVWPTNGPILLQCEGSEVFFRKFELQRLK
ncbi:MAG: DUF1080 domain-containing protein [Verrucomicrobia bacterium]|nr:DUF1080 domain-containing protein [Verrucomicrobiota bacterium]